MAFMWVPLKKLPLSEVRNFTQRNVPFLVSVRVYKTASTQLLSLSNPVCYFQRIPHPNKLPACKRKKEEKSRWFFSYLHFPKAIKSLKKAHKLSIFEQCCLEMFLSGLLSDNSLSAINLWKCCHKSLADMGNRNLLRDTENLNVLYEKGECDSVRFVSWGTQSPSHHANLEETLW